MKDNLTDKEKLEIERYAEEKIKKKMPGAYENVSSFFSLLSGLGFLLIGIIFLSIFPVAGIIIIIMGGLFINSSNKSQEKVKKIRKEKEEKLIKELQLKALQGENWKE